MAKLYVVGTPIGNMADITYRAVETLKSVDFICAEDTRVTLKLLNHYEIKKPVISYHEHNEDTVGDSICDRIAAGENAAIVTDAGMPCISDPGERLVRRCYERGIEVTVVPGPVACASALAISGLDTSRFSFEGFLSVNRKNRAAHLAQLAAEQRTMLFYEAPHKLIATLTDLTAQFGPNRRVALCRELTKLHEQVYRTTLGQALEHYQTEAPRGEFVLVVEGCAPPKEPETSLEDALAAVDALCAEGMSRRDAVKQVSSDSGIGKNQLYRAAQEREGGDG